MLSTATPPTAEYERYAKLPDVIHHPGGVIEIPEQTDKLRRIAQYLTDQHNAQDDRELRRYYNHGGILIDALINNDVAAPITKAAIDRLIANYNREHFD